NSEAGPRPLRISDILRNRREIAAAFDTRWRSAMQPESAAQPTATPSSQVRSCFASETSHATCLCVCLWRDELCAVPGDLSVRGRLGRQFHRPALDRLPCDRSAVAGAVD